MVEHKLSEKYVEEMVRSIPYVFDILIGKAKSVNLIHEESPMLAYGKLNQSKQVLLDKMHEGLHPQLAVVLIADTCKSTDATISFVEELIESI